MRKIIIFMLISFSLIANAQDKGRKKFNLVGKKVISLTLKHRASSNIAPGQVISLGAVAQVEGKKGMENLSTIGILGGGTFWSNYKVTVEPGTFRNGQVLLDNDYTKFTEHKATVTVTTLSTTNSVTEKLEFVLNYKGQFVADFSGKEGKNGFNGETGSYGVYGQPSVDGGRGGNGKNGRNGGTGLPGDDVTVSVSAYWDEIIKDTLLKVLVESSNSDHTEHFLINTKGGVLFVNANGGQGGQGGHGGTGGLGGSGGYEGRNGGDGGNGGNGANGGNGGKGGKIVFNIDSGSERYMHLLKYSNKGGVGGDPGLAGSGGVMGTATYSGGGKSGKMGKSGTKGEYSGSAGEDGPAVVFNNKPAPKISSLNKLTKGTTSKNTAKKETGSKVTATKNITGKNDDVAIQLKESQVKYNIPVLFDEKSAIFNKWKCKGIYRVNQKIRVENDPVEETNTDTIMESDIELISMDNGIIMRNQGTDMKYEFQGNNKYSAKINEKTTYKGIVTTATGITNMYLLKDADGNVALKSDTYSKMENTGGIAIIMIDQMLLLPGVCNIPATSYANKNIDEEEKTIETEISSEAKAEAEAKVRAEYEAKLKAEAEAKVKAEYEAKLKAETEAKARAEYEAKLKAEAEAKVRAEYEAKLKAEAEAKVKAEYEAKLKAEAEVEAKAEYEAKLKSEAETKAELEARIKAEIEAKVRAEYEAKLGGKEAVSVKKEPETNVKGSDESKNEASGMSNRISDSKPVKCKTCFYTNPETIVANNVKVNLLDIVSLYGSETKLKIEIENLGNPYLFIRVEDFIFTLDKDELNARKAHFKVIEPNKKDEFVIRTNNSGVRKEKMGIKLSGIYVMDTISKPVPKTFSLGQKETIGNFTVSMFDVKLKSDVRSYYKIEYKGEGVGVFDPMNLLLMISGKEYRPTVFQQKVFFTNGEIREIRIDHNNYLKTNDTGTVRIIDDKAFIDTKLVPLYKDEPIILNLDDAKSIY